MKNINEYDKRQLKLMYESLISFEKSHIELNSLVGNLEFLLSAMESVEADWEEKFLREVTTLETINAIKIIKESGEEAPEINNNKSKKLINNSLTNLKNLIEKELMNEHQRQLWQNMIDLIESYLKNESQDFYGIVGKLEESLDASEIKDTILINQWYDFWTPLETLRVMEGNQVNRVKAIKKLIAMKEFLIEHR